MKSVLDKTVEDHEVTIISRSKDKDVVLLSLQDYNSWMETMHLLRSNNNRKRLVDAIERVEKGNFIENNLIEE